MLWQPAAFVLRASPAALVLFASFARASPCLSSAAAVRQEHPRSWPSCTLRAEGYVGVKCRFPTDSAPGRDQTTRQISPAETATAVRASTPSTRDPGISAALVATNGIGRSRETLSPQDIAILSREWMFVDRFIFEESYFAGPADSQQAIERFSEAAARLRMAPYFEARARASGIQDRLRSRCDARSYTLAHRKTESGKLVFCRFRSSCVRRRGQGCGATARGVAARA
jgi:hypothetical protein